MVAERFHGLDALRASALLLGIFLHSAISFCPVWSEGIDWAIRDQSTSLVPAIFVFWAHTFRLAAFFLMAGFFGHLVLHRKGQSYFIRDRLRRILLPLLLGWALIYPIASYVWTWGRRVSGLPQFAEMFAEYSHLPTWQLTLGYLVTGAAFEGGIRLIHLWFLYYLLMLYGIALIVRWVFVRWFDSNANLRKKLDVCVLKLVESQFGVVWLSLPIGLVIYWMNNDLGLRTPEVGFRPDLLSVLAYGIMFALGWLLHRQTRLLSILRQRFVQYLIAGSLLTLGPFYIMITGSHDGLAARTVHAALCSLAMVLLTFGFTGLFLRYCSGYRPTVRYLSDASYWLYIVHLPLVGALQVALSQLPWHWSLKFILILLVSVPLLLLSYQYLVRYTWIGRLLNGPRRRGELHEKPPPAARFESTPTLSAG